MAKERVQYAYYCSPELMAEIKDLAKCYRLSVNMLITLCLEGAIEDWSVHGQMLRNREGKVIEESEQVSPNNNS